MCSQWLCQPDATQQQQQQQREAARRWNPAIAQRFFQQVRTEGVQQILQQAIDSSDPATATATAAFLAAIHTALDGAQPAARRPSASSPAPADASWFTEDCRQLRREYLRQLYRHPTSRACREARRAYKACVRRCKRVAAVEAADLLKHLLSGDPRQFWRLVKGRSTRRAVQGTLRGWQEYIKHLMGQQMPTATDQHGQWPVAGVPSSNSHPQ
jgi:hypothetical protein